MSILRQLAGQTAIYGLSSIIGRLLNYLLVPIYTRIFLPEEYGVVTEFYAIAGFMLVIYSYGMETAFFRFAEKEGDKSKVFDTAMGSLFFSSVLLTGCLILFSNSLAELLRYPAHPEYIIWFALIFGLDALAAIPFANLRKENKAFTFAAIRLLNIGTNIGMNLFFLLLCPYILANYEQSTLTNLINKVYDENIGAGYVFISNLVASFISIFLLLPQYFKIKLSMDFGVLKKMLAYSLPLVIVGLAGIVNEMLDRILLKWLLPGTNEENLAQIGIYGANYKLSVLMTLFIQAYRYAAEPFFFAQSIQQDAKKTYALTMKYFTIASCVIFLGVTLFLDIFKHFIGSAYHEGLHVVPILLLANLLLGIYFNLSFWYKLTDKTGWGAMIAVSGAVMTIALNVWLIPIMGYTGSAWATLGCYFFMVVISFIAGQKYYPIRYEKGRIIFYIGLAVGLFFLNNMIVLRGEEAFPLLKYLSPAFLFALFIFLVARVEGIKTSIMRRKPK